MPPEKSLPIESRARELLHAIHALIDDAESADLLPILGSMSGAGTREMTEIAATLDLLYAQACEMRSGWKALIASVRVAQLREG